MLCFGRRSVASYLSIRGRYACAGTNPGMSVARLSRTKNALPPRVLAVDEPVAFPPPELFERGDRGVGVPLKNRQSNEAR